MSGSVFKVQVKPGDTVGKGQVVVVLEAMKMEIPVESTKQGIVREVLVKQGDAVSEGDVLLRF